MSFFHTVTAAIPYCYEFISARLRLSSQPYQNIFPHGYENVRNRTHPIFCKIPLLCALKLTFVLTIR